MATTLNASCKGKFQKIRAATDALRNLVANLLARARALADQITRHVSESKHDAQGQTEARRPALANDDGFERPAPAASVAVAQSDCLAQHLHDGPPAPTEVLQLVADVPQQATKAGGRRCPAARLLRGVRIPIAPRRVRVAVRKSTNQPTLIKASVAVVGLLSLCHTVLPAPVTVAPTPPDTVVGAAHGFVSGKALMDDFNDGSQDTAKWTETVNITGRTHCPTVSVTETSGRLVITPLSRKRGAHYNGYRVGQLV